MKIKWNKETIVGKFTEDRLLLKMCIRDRYSTVLCIMLMILAYCEKKRILSEYTIILAFIILFHFGQSIIYIFEPTRYLPVFSEFSEECVIKALKYSMICLQVFDVVFSFYYPAVENKVKYTGKSSQSYLDAVSYTHLLLVMVDIACPRIQSNFWQIMQMFRRI